MAWGATAAQLRLAAEGMVDSNDRDTMLRLAAGYEHRAAIRARQIRSE